jgi:hypothetical protein
MPTLDSTPLSSPLRSQRRCYRLPGPWVGLVLALALPLAGAEERLETHALRSETAERLLPLIEPLMPEGAAISGRGGHLFVRGDPQTQDEVRRLLDELDRPPQRLLIQVRDRTVSGVRAEGADAAARLEAGDTTRLRARSRVFSTGDLREATGTDRIQVVAGEPARVASGSAIALPLLALLPAPGGAVTTQAGVAWIEAGRETWLRARPTRDGGVIVDIAATREALLPGAAGVTGNGISTTVTGPLASWFDLGGSQLREGRERTSARVFSTQQLRSQNSGFEMRVDVLP